MSRALFRTSSRFNTPYFRERMAAQGVVSVPQTLATQPRLAFAPPDTGPARDVLIVIFQRGGMDGLSALVPYGDGADYYNPRPTIAVPEPGQTNGCLDLGGGFGLHPSLTGFKNLYDAGQLAIVRATGSIDPTRSHFDAMRYMEQGVPGDKTVGTGWIARHLQTAASQNTAPLRAVGFGSLVQASLRGFSALALESIADFHLQGRWDQIAAIRAELETLYHVSTPAGLLDTQAKLVLETIDLLDTISGQTYTPENGAVYPADDYFAEQIKQIAQLIKANVGLEVACVDIGGWDTHETQGTIGGTFDELIRQLGDGITALVTDLGAAMANVTIVTMSEFGRRLEENGSQGLDHGHGNAMFIIGGGVNGGQLYGAWPGLAEDKLNDGDLDIQTDQRHVLAELVGKRLVNTALTSVFPGFTATPPGIFQQR